MKLPAARPPEVETVLNDLLARMRQVLGDQLVGVYLYGSLVAGGFDLAVSDIDLLAVTQDTLAPAELEQLHAMHDAVAARYPAWYDRIEVAYLSLSALKTFRTQVSPIAIISPGEPFHVKEAGADWLINWWVIRQQGEALYGPPAAAVIDPITDEEYLAAVQRQAQEWRTYVYEMTRRKSQAYAVLTLCRAYYAYTNRRQVSKQEAAAWAAAALPQWADVIHDAVAWRVAPTDDGVDHAATFDATVRFVNYVADQMA